MDPTREYDRWNQVLTPTPTDGAVWIHQDAYFSVGTFSADTPMEYILNRSGHGVYLFVLEGSATVAGETIGRRDGLGITDTDRFELTAGPEGTRILAMEVPMLQ